VRRLLLAVLLVAASMVVMRGQVSCDVLPAQPACDVALLPGPTANTLEIVTIEGERTFPSAGQLRLTTVAVDGDLTLREWFDARFSATTDLVDRDLIYPRGTTSEDVAEENAALMVQSQVDATVAGLVAAGFDADELRGGARIVAFAERAADGVDLLSEDDVIVAVDGTPVDRADGVVALVAQHVAGDTIVVTLEDGRDVPLVAIGRPDDPARALLGLLLADELDLPFEVGIDAGNIGGPSAGLMFALGIVDLLAAEDLTNGTTIAGTGTISVDGAVGAIGGIRQKIVGATSPTDDEVEPATVFLVPAGNLAEARTASVSSDVLLVPVATIDEALAALRALGRGEQPTGAVALGP
jgi:Lon-like protease